MLWSQFFLSDRGVPAHQHHSTWATSARRPSRASGGRPALPWWHRSSARSLSNQPRPQARVERDGGSCRYRRRRRALIKRLLGVSRPSGVRVLAPSGSISMKGWLQISRAHRAGQTHSRREAMRDCIASRHAGFRIPTRRRARGRTRTTRHIVCRGRTRGLADRAGCAARTDRTEHPRATSGRHLGW